MTWDELLEVLQAMTVNERSAEVVVFDYERNEFLHAEVCLEGDPPVHLTIN